MRVDDQERVRAVSQGVAVSVDLHLPGTLVHTEPVGDNQGGTARPGRRHPILQLRVLTGDRHRPLLRHTGQVSRRTDPFPAQPRLGAVDTGRLAGLPVDGAVRQDVRPAW